MKEVRSCQNCGDKRHTLNKCTQLFTPCQYSHIGNVENPPHSTYMCPDLMAHCKICNIRGHRMQEHAIEFLRQSPLELRTQFKKFAHLGKYSSLPFLYKSGAIKDFHFRASLSATTMSRAQNDLWTYCGRLAKLSKEALEKADLEKERVTSNLYSDTTNVVWCKGDGD